MSRPFLNYVRASSPLSLLRKSSRPRISMPLRAKITNPAFSRPYSDNMTSPAATSTAAPPTPEPADPEADNVLFNSTFGVRAIELNLPKTYNALNGSMIEKITRRLQEWEKSQLANIIVIKGAGQAFCSGGDVVELANQIKNDAAHESVMFFAQEYRLNHLIATYSKPYVAFMDGHTMGGGIGLSVHAPFRIATERTVTAMPETRIGFFPDVGGSFFLPRLDGGIGTYLGLTSKILNGVQAFYAGFATHYIHSSSLPDLEARLSELVFSDTLSLADRWSIVNDTIEEFSTGLPSEAPLLSGALRESIDRCFCRSTIEGILTALEAEDTEWARATIATIRKRSPTAVRVTLKQLQAGRHWNIAETFQHEYHIAARFMAHPDFVEGVTELLIAKTNNPAWNPPTLEDTPEDVVETFLQPPEGAEKLVLLKTGAEEYMKYPHEMYGLPREKAVRDVVKQARMGPDAIIEWFVHEYKGKEGVREKVRDVLARRTIKDEKTGFVVWDASKGWWDDEPRGSSF